MARNSSHMLIGALSRKTGLAPSTLRYYERLGLLASRGRTQGGYRTYGPDIFERIELIKMCREMGLLIREIKEVLSMGDSPERQERMRSLVMKPLLRNSRKMADLVEANLKILAFLERWKPGPVPGPGS